MDADREWAAYAIGDLGPEYIDHCEWHVGSEPSGDLLLVYRGFTPPVVFAMGPETTALVVEIDAPVIALHVKPEALVAIERSYVPITTRAMHRMVLPPAHFKPVHSREVRTLSAVDLPAIAALYDDGYPRGEGPTFFDPSMLRQGTFRGVYEGDELVAVAGTHLYSATLGVCAIGNVYTRSDRRGRGHSARVTSAVVGHALGDGIATIVLNVDRHNSPARRVYERLGFRHYCDFIEGEASRR